jgi:hypothetical protein
MLLPTQEETPYKAPFYPLLLLPPASFSCNLVIPIRGPQQARPACLHPMGSGMKMQERKDPHSASVSQSPVWPALGCGGIPSEERRACVAVLQGSQSPCK